MNRSVKELFRLFGVQLKTLLWETKEWLKVASRYYGNATFRKVDLHLLISSLFDDPFAKSRRYLKMRGEANLYQYGETPLTTFETIVEHFSLRREDVVYELGAGRGRVSFWLASHLGCSVVAIEQIPSFVKQGKALKNQFGVENLKWILGDFLEEDLSPATVLFLFGSMMRREEIFKLLQNCKSLKSGTKIITVSFPLKDYDLEGITQPLKRMKGNFPWGKTSIYLQCKV